MELRNVEAWRRPLTPGEQLRMYVYEWLTHLGCLGDDQIRWLIRMMHPETDKFGRWLEAYYQNPGLAAKGEKRSKIALTLAIADQRYAVWPGQSGFADLQNEVFLSRLEKPGKTHIIGDFLAIFEEKQDWLKSLGVSDGGHQHHAGGDAAQAHPEGGGEGRP